MLPYEEMLKIENPRSIRPAKNRDLRGKDGIWLSETSVRKPMTTWPFAPGAEGCTGSPERGSGPRGLRTARVTAECWRGLLVRGAPQGMLPAGVDGARSTPTRAHDLHPSDPPPSRGCISGAALSPSPPSRGFQTTPHLPRRPHCRAMRKRKNHPLALPVEA